MIIFSREARVPPPPRAGGAPVRSGCSRRFGSYASLLRVRTFAPIDPPASCEQGRPSPAFRRKIRQKSSFASVFYIQFPALARHTRTRIRPATRGWDKKFFRSAPRPSPAPARGRAGPGGGGGRTSGRGRSPPSRPPTARRRAMRSVRRARRRTRSKEERREPGALRKKACAEALRGLWPAGWPCERIAPVFRLPERKGRNTNEKSRRESPQALAACGRNPLQSVIRRGWQERAAPSGAPGGARPGFIAIRRYPFQVFLQNSAIMESLPKR